MDMDIRYGGQLTGSVGEHPVIDITVDARGRPVVRVWFTRARVELDRAQRKRDDIRDGSEAVG